MPREADLRVSDLSVREVGVDEKGEGVGSLGVRSQTSQVCSVSGPVDTDDGLRRTADGGEHARDAALRFVDGQQH